MTIQQLKDRATAAELALIEKVEGMLVEETKAATITKLVDFMVKNPPDIERRPESFGMPTIGRAWFERLKSHFSDGPHNGETKRPVDTGNSHLKHDHAR
jgi:hypothetical protein